MPGTGVVRRRRTVTVRFGAVTSPLLSTSRRLDALGLGLIGLLAAWVGFFSGDGSGHPGPVLLLLFGLVVATAVGRVLAVRRGLVPRLLATSIAGAIILTWPGLLSAGGAPTGYANANATLASLGVIAALAAARTARQAADGRAWIALGIVLALFTASTGSVAGVLSLVLALGLLGLSAVTRWPAFVIVGGLIAVSVTIGVTTTIALGDDPVGLAARSDVRGELWAAAADFVDEAPGWGIGAGEFAEQNPVSDDADLRWAHHGYLQAAAEYGIVGFLLVLALAGWVWARLWNRSFSHPAEAVLGGAGLLIVGLHAAVDYVWHVPAVMLVLAVLVGNSLGRDPAPRRPDEVDVPVPLAPLPTDHGPPSAVRLLR